MNEKVQYTIAESDTGFEVTDPQGVSVAKGDSAEDVTTAVRNVMGDEVDLVMADSESTDEEEADEDTADEEVVAEDADEEEEGEADEEDAPEAKTVPLAALHEERAKRRELEERLANVEVNQITDIIPKNTVNPLANLDDDDVLSVGQLRQLNTQAQFTNLQSAMDTYARSAKTDADPLAPSQAVQLVVSALKQNPEMVNALAAHPDPIGRIRATAQAYLEQTGKIAGSLDGVPPPEAVEEVKEVKKKRTKKSLTAKKGVHPSLGKGSGSGNLGDEVTGHINRLANLDGEDLTKYMENLGKAKRDEVLQAMTNQRAEG